MGFFAEEGTTGLIYLRTISGILKLVIIFVSLVPTALLSLHFNNDVLRIQFTEQLALHDFIIVSDAVQCSHVEIFGDQLIENFTNSSGIGAESIKVDCVSKRIILSARGIALVSLLLATISLVFYMLNGHNTIYPAAWRMVNSVWTAVSIVLLLIAAVICYMQAGICHTQLNIQATSVYRKSAHCVAHAANLQNIESFDSDQLADLEHTELCKGGLKYMDAEASIAGTFLLIGCIPYGLLFYIGGRNIYG